MTIATPTAPAPEREKRCLSGEIRADKSDGKIRLSGHAAVYDTKSQPIYGMFTEIVRRGAFARALRGDDDVLALVDHDSSMVLGRTRSGTLKLSDDDKGLRFEVLLPETTVAKDLAELVQRGDISQMSFGFRKLKDRWTEEVKDGKLLSNTRELLEVELFDVSPVTYPAYPETDVAVRSLEAYRQSRDSGDHATRLARLRLALAGANG